MEKDKTLSVIVPAEMAREVEAIAKQEDRSVSYLVRKAIEQWLESRKRATKRAGGR